MGVCREDHDPTVILMLGIRRVLWWNSNTLATWCEELTPWERPWCWERLKPEGKGDDRGSDGWMASPTWWTWVWASSRCWWWTGKPGMLQSMGSKRVGHDWRAELTCGEKGNPHQLLRSLVFSFLWHQAPLLAKRPLLVATLESKSLSISQGCHLPSTGSQCYRHTKKWIHHPVTMTQCTIKDKHQ